VSILVDALPIATDDSASTTPGTARLIPALLNDADPEGLPLTIIDAAILPEPGNAHDHPDGQLLYTPAAGVIGTVTGSYTIRDEAATSPRECNDHHHADSRFAAAARKKRLRLHRAADAR
jgi:hypothetical protein